MSQWTHVNASIRFDGMSEIELPSEKDLGRICRWDDEDWSHWENPDLPCGSEGSIEYKIIKNPLKSCLAAMVIVFYGDLRDYNNVNEILEYFNKIIKNRSIRSGILEIEVEYGDTLVYRFDYDKNQWINIA